MLAATTSCGGDDASSPVADAASGTDAGTTTDAANGPKPTQGSSNGYAYAYSPTSAGFGCADSLEQMLAKGAVSVTVGPSTIVVGYEQIGATDQDPIVARYDAGQKVFCEHSKKGGGVDGRAYGLTWDGGKNLYVVYTIVGGGTLFDTAAAGGWLKSYGNGGASAKATVIGKLDPQTGVVTRATFVSSKLVKNGQQKTNTLVPADALHALADGTFEFFGTPTWCTLNPDQSIMCDPSSSADYPKDYRARFTADLATMTCASASGVSVVKQPCP
jgi:hypothetical protein